MADDLRNELTAKITHDEKALNSMKEAERHLATTVSTEHRAMATIGNGSTAFTSTTSRPFALPAAKKVSAVDYFVRAGALMYLAHRHHKTIDDVIRTSPYAEDMPTRALIEYQSKAASAAALMTVTGWALELVQQIYTDLMPT
jgi:hypothetical protein